MKEYKKVVQYWLKTAAHDYFTMQQLFKIKLYSDSLFFGHIVIEKIIKAYYVKETKDLAPYSHDLIYLSSKLKTLKLNEQDNNLLDEINSFNIRARYPDEKLLFYKLCTYKFSLHYIKKIDLLYNKICRQINNK